MLKKALIIVGILILIAGAVFFWMSTQSKDEEESTTITEETFVEDIPEPTIAPPEFELSDYSITILNGSGIAGLAGDMQEDLEADDFVVEDTGNADSYDYDTTIIQAKTTVPDEYVELLESAIQGKFGPVDIEELDEEEDGDVVIIIGGQQDEDPVEDTETEEESTEDEESEEEPTPTDEPAPTEEEEE